MTIIELGNGYCLSPIGRSDKAAYINHFKEREIYERTLNIPFPYEDKDADFWFGLIDEWQLKNKRPVVFAIRNRENELIGSIGFDGLIIDSTHKTELGYWLAKPYWGRGIMTVAVAKVCELGFGEFKLTRITAHIFAFNVGSQKVLEKNGFEFEGLLRKNYIKDGSYFDGKLFAKVM